MTTNFRLKIEIKSAKEIEQGPYFIPDLQEIKTTWHPIENIGVSWIKY